MNKCIKFLFCVFILVSISGCTGDSSEGFFLGKKPEYEVKNETRNKTIILRATLKSGEVSNVGIESGRGIIKWMCDEGTEVRTGDDLVHISMENTEDRVRNRKYRLANRIDSMENLNAAGPSEIAEIDKALFEKMLLLEKSLFEEKWIRNPKTIDEILKIKNNAKIAEIDYEHAKKMYALKKIVAEKGFDSKFSLKSAEIDLRSKEIEFEYAKRSLMQLNEPPLAEDIMKNHHQQAAASNEIWLAQNEKQASDISLKIRLKNMEVNLEGIRTRLREEEKSLEGRILKAPRDGIVIHPVLWGSYKFSVGSNAWSKVGIVQVIGEDKCYLDALADELSANQLQENASASIEFDSLPGEFFVGRVDFISKAPRKLRGMENSRVKYYPVSVSVDVKGRVSVGSKATIKVFLGSKTGIFVPMDAVKKQENSYVITAGSYLGEKIEENNVEVFDRDWIIINPKPSLSEFVTPEIHSNAGDFKSKELTIARGEFVSLKRTDVSPGMMTEVLKLVPEGSKVKAGEDIAHLSAGKRIRSLEESILNCKIAELETEKYRNLLSLNEELETITSGLAKLELKICAKEYERSLALREWSKLYDLRQAKKVDFVKNKMLEKNLDATIKMFNKGFATEEALMNNKKAFSVNKLNASLTLDLMDIEEKYPDEKNVFYAKQALDKAKKALETVELSRNKIVSNNKLNLNESLRNLEQQELQVKKLEAEIASLTVKSPKDGIVLYGYTYDGIQVVKIREGAQIFSGLNFLQIVDPFDCGFSFALDQRDAPKSVNGKYEKLYFRADACPEYLFDGALDSRVPIALELQNSKPEGRLFVFFKAKVEKFPQRILIGYSGTVFCGDAKEYFKSRFKGNRVFTVTKRTMRRTASSGGEAYPANASYILSHLNGAKVSNLLPEGASVSKGDIIANLDNEDLAQSVSDTEIELEKKKEEYDLLMQKAQIEKEKMEKRFEVSKSELDVAKMSHVSLLKRRDEDRIIDLEKRIEIAGSKILLAEEKFAHLSELRLKGLSSEMDILEVETELASLRREQSVASYDLEYEKSGPSSTSVYISELNVRKAELNVKIAEVKMQIADFESLSSLKLLEAEVHKLKQSVDRQKADIEAFSIRAPEAGIVILNEFHKTSGEMGKVKVGDSLQEGIPFMLVADTNDLHIKTKVTEIEAGFIKTGAEVKVLINNTDKVLKGWVYSVGVAASTEMKTRQDATVEVVVTLRSPLTGEFVSDSSLRPGSSCEVEFELYNEKDVLFLPFDGLLPGSDGGYVVNENKEINKIDILFSDGLNGYAVKSGLKEGERILLMESSND